MWGLTVLASVLVLCCVGAAAGSGVGWFTSRPGEPALPPVPAGFPAGAYLPHFDLEATVGVLAADGFDCELDGEYPFDCGGPDLPGISSGRVVAEFHDPGGVLGVTVICGSADDNRSACGELFAPAVEGVLAGGPDDVREQARTWVGQNAAGDATTVAGEVELTVRDHGAISELRITAA